VAIAARARLALLVGTLVVGGLVLVIVFTRKKKVEYSISVSAALLRQPSDEPLRVQGNMRRRSLCKVTSQCQYRLLLADAHGSDAGVAPTLEVLYANCMLPEYMLYDAPAIELEVTAEGTLGPNRKLLATQVITKCPGVYYRRPNPSWQGRLRPIPECD
jgi:cytochrome c-type biogenesis protein CcmE